jgi:hypothetical protein
MTDGCVHLLYNSSWKFSSQRASVQPLWRYGTSITSKMTPAGSLSSSQPGGPPYWPSPLAFGLIGCKMFYSVCDCIIKYHAERSKQLKRPNLLPPPPPLGSKRCITARCFIPLVTVSKSTNQREVQEAHAPSTSYSLRLQEIHNCMKT